MKNFDKSWLKNIDLEVLSFLDNLKKSNQYEYRPSLRGTTEQGHNIKLGFSCYALKILYILDNKTIEDGVFEPWTKYLNSFQKKYKDFSSEFLY